ncbi:MAG: hypothetical protein B5M53_09485 [Candidatus Cloacimonas sp. 4484_209]|nr:MAG: hypothetical protein B5M53_09485 [Candidatus Cloacimonas sp. 4484_209]
MPLGDRLILSKEISQKINFYLVDFLNLSLAKAVLLITKGGQLLQQYGISKRNSKLFPIVSLISGIFSSTQNLATLLGESEFKHFFQEGVRFSIYYSLLIDPFVIVTIFDKTAILGDIQLKVDELEDKIKQMLINTINAKKKEPVFVLSSRSPEEAFSDLFDFNIEKS